MSYTIEIPKATMVSLNAARGTYPGIAVGTAMRVTNCSYDEAMIKQSATSPSSARVDFEPLTGLRQGLPVIYINAGSLESWIYCEFAAITVSVEAV